MLREEDYAKDDDIILPSGARFAIQIAPFDKARNLFKVILREVMGTVSTDLFHRDAKNFILQALIIGSSSDAIERAAEECLRHCVYNGLRFNMDMMQKPENRQDYITCLFHVCEYNIRPFLNSLFVLSLSLAESATGIQTNINSQNLQ